MIIGVGVDIVKVGRIGKNIEKQAFLDKVYTKNEQEYLQTRKFNHQTAAGLFAAKEAVSKAFGTGICGFNITDIEIVKDKKDKPEVLLHNNAFKISKEKGIDSISLSITHEAEYAVAFVVAEKY